MSGPVFDFAAAVRTVLFRTRSPQPPALLCPAVLCPAGVFLACVMLAIAAAPNLAAAELDRLRFSTSPERTRVVLDLSSPTEYVHRTLSNPPRVLISFENGSIQPDVRPVRVDDGFIERIRFNSIKSGRVQVVLDLTQDCEYSSFTLNDPPRIVVDIAHGSQAPVGLPPSKDPGPVVMTETNVVQPVSIPEREGPWVVAVDAGHGGEDPGCQYHRTDEKDIALALGRELQAALNARPGFKAFMTRKGDYAIPLSTRRRMAEDKNADLFVSIHCNAATNPEARGTEVFFLSVKGASDQAAKELAHRENSVDANWESESGEVLDDIVFDMVQTDVMVKSEILAESCLDALVDLGTVYNRGVKQAGFVVLKSPRIPSVLVEAGFLSNAQDTKLLRDGKWRQQFGRYLADGIVSYCQGLDMAAGSTPVR